MWDTVKKQIVEGLRQSMDPDRLLVCAQKGSQEIYMLIRGGEREAVKCLVGRQICRLYEKGLDDKVFSFHSFQGIENLEDAGKRVRDNAGWSLTLGRRQIISDERIRELAIQKFIYPSDLEQAIIRRINTGELGEIEDDIRAFVRFLNDKTYACAGYPGGIGMPYGGRFICDPQGQLWGLREYQSSELNGLDSAAPFYGSLYTDYDECAHAIPALP